MSVSTMYQYKCNICGDACLLVEPDRGAKIMGSFAHDGEGIIRKAGAGIHICARCDTALAEMYKREMESKEENEG